MHTITRVVGGIAVALVLVPVSGCGVVTGMTGNKSEVCDDTKAAFEAFGEKLKTVSPTDGAEWARAIGDFAGELDGLAKKAEDGKLRTVLGDFAGSWRTTTPEIAQNGDVAQLTVLLREQPARLGTACA
ncbi:MAG: hypothetical protein ABIS86_07815 [Streptosporangiaceae bacterium]